MSVKSILKDYKQLSKSSITYLVMVITALGFYLGNFYSQEPWYIDRWKLLLAAIISSGLFCAGACTFNHIFEHRVDKKMERTKNRPIPAGRISILHACFFAIAIIALACTIGSFVGVTFVIGALLTIVLYVCIYTPMKKISIWNTTVGALPGALPALGGWVASYGKIDYPGIILLLFLMLWQHPHFYVISLLMKEDYQKGGFKMLPLIKNGVERTYRIIMALTFLLLPVTLVYYYLGKTSYFYLIAMFLLGIWFFFESHLLYKNRHTKGLLRFLKMTIYYPIFFFVFLLLDSLFI